MTPCNLSLLQPVNVSIEASQPFCGEMSEIRDHCSRIVILSLKSRFYGLLIPYPRRNLPTLRPYPCKVSAFGRLLGLRQSRRPPGRHGGTYWVCLCDCGHRKRVEGAQAAVCPRPVSTPICVFLIMRWLFPLVRPSRANSDELWKWAEALLGDAARLTLRFEPRPCQSEFGLSRAISALRRAPHGCRSLL